ncbi:MAG: DUF1294 domain-containing protein [Anaerolineales bacterium]|nr:DUF1294 domain-containing protein [Anaerolineales bacterium]
MKQRPRYFFGLIGIVATAVLFIIMQATTNWAWMLNWLISASVVTFVFYALDKGSAKAGTYRIPEMILHLMAIIGGFVGALLGMLVFRHKTNFREHPVFLPVIIISFVLWAAAAYFLYLR